MLAIKRGNVTLHLADICQRTFCVLHLIYIVSAFFCNNYFPPYGLPQYLRHNTRTVIVNC